MVHSNKVFGAQVTGIWSWSHKPYLRRFSKRHQRRNEVVDKGSSESNIWVLRLLVCGPGFTSSI